MSELFDPRIERRSVPRGPRVPPTVPATHGRAEEREKTGLSQGRAEAIHEESRISPG